MTPKLTKEQEERHFKMTQNCVVPEQIDELPDDAWVSGWFAAMEHSKAFLAQELERAREEIRFDLGIEIVPLVQKFIDKVDSGRARSVETYADMKKVLALFNKPR